MTTAHELVDNGRIEGDAIIVYYWRGHGRSWLLSWNYANPDTNDEYEAFSSEKDLRRWCRETHGHVNWLQVSGRGEQQVWRGVVRGSEELQ